MRIWRCEVAARRARPVNEKKRSPVVRKRKPGVEQLEDRVPMGSFFNGFGFGAANVLPVGLSMPGARPAGAALVSVAAPRHAETSQLDLEGNPAALQVAILSHATNADAGSAAAQIEEALGSLATDSDGGNPFSSESPSAHTGGSEVTPPNSALHGAGSAVFATLPVQSAQGPAQGTAPIGTQSPSNSTDAMLFQAVSAAAAGSGKTKPGGAAPLAPPTGGGPQMPPPAGGGGGGAGGGEQEVVQVFLISRNGIQDFLRMA